MFFIFCHFKPSAAYKKYCLRLSFFSTTASIPSIRKPDAYDAETFNSNVRER